VVQEGGEGAAMVTAGGGNSFKDRTFTDFDIDPLTLDAEGNDKVLDLIEENNTLTHEVSFMSLGSRTL
jgi:hypothetical protein